MYQLGRCLGWKTWVAVLGRGCNVVDCAGGSDGEGSDCCSCIGKWRGTLGLPRDQLAATDALCPHRTCAAPRVVIRTGQPEPLGGDRLASGCPVQAATLHVKLMKRCPLLSRERSVNPCTRFMRPFCL